MRQKKYAYDLFVQILLVVVVILLFRMNQSRVQASFWASTLFFLMPLSMMIREWFFFRLENRLWWSAVLQFWLLFAIPIFVLRISYPHTSIGEISIGPLSMGFWHQLSSYSYALLFLITIRSAWKFKKQKP
jgi:hypothetical protein